MSSDVEHAGRKLVGTLIALLLLTAASWGFAQLHLGTAGPIVALTIAALKAGAVAWIFMELAHAAVTARVVVVVTVLFILLLCLGISADTLLR